MTATKRALSCLRRSPWLWHVVLVRDIPFSSHCEHQWWAFLRHAAFCLLPVRDRRRRAFQACETRRWLRQTPATQEADDAQIIGAIDKHLRPRGCAVMIEAQHLCMSMRGVRKHGADTVTTPISVIFRDDPASSPLLDNARGSSEDRAIAQAPLVAPGQSWPDPLSGPNFICAE